MRTLFLILLAILLFVLLVSGTVLNLMLVIIKVAGSIVLTREVVWALYLLATVIVIGLLWLFIKIGGR